MQEDRGYMKRNKLIVVSADAMVDADLELMETLPKVEGKDEVTPASSTCYPTSCKPSQWTNLVGSQLAR